MAYVIKDHSDPPRYYTGSDWSEDESQASRFQTKTNAEDVIQKHKMLADAVEASDLTTLP